MFFKLFLIINLFKISLSNFTISQKNEIVNIHNNMRSNLTLVPAANMIKLRWSDFLENEAKKLADTCIFEHFVDNYGQNLFMGSYSENIMNRIGKGINLWYDEINDHSDYILSNIENSNLVGIDRYDHISQVLWATTSEIGCSYSKCDNSIYLVCNYFTPGNFQGMEWFISGEPCSLCPDNFIFCENKLCTDYIPEPITLTLIPETNIPNISIPTSTPSNSIINKC